MYPLYHHFKSCLLIFHLFALFAATGCQGNESVNKDIGAGPDVVYTIGDSYTLTFSDLHAYARNRGVHFRYDDALEGYTDVMYEMVGNQFKRFDFFDRNLHENQELLLPMQRYINEELVAAYYNQEFYEKYLTDSFLRDAHEKMQHEVIYRQIVLFDAKHVQEGEQRTLESIADSIVGVIEQGGDFSMLVRTYSQDQGSIRTNGYAQPATWTRSLRFPVDSIVFQLNPGDVDVIRHNNAHYIVQVTDRNIVRLDPFEQMEEEIRQRVKDALRPKSVEEYETFLERLVDEGSLEWNDESVEIIIRWFRQPVFFSSAIYRDVIGEAIEEGNNFEIVSYDDGVVDLKKLLFLLDNILIPSDSPTFSKKMVKEYLVEALREMKVGELAKEAGLLEQIFNPVTRNWAIRNEILIAYNNHIIESQIPEPTQERLRAFYEQYKDSLFYQLRTVTARIISAESESRIEELKSQYEAGTPFTELAHRIQVRVFYRDRDGTVNVRNNRPQPGLQDIAIKLEEGDVVGPVEFHHPDYGTVPSLVWASRVLPEKQLSFEEASNRIEMVFREYQRAKINETTISDIRENYDYRFYEEHLIKNLKDRGLL